MGTKPEVVYGIVKKIVVFLSDVLYIKEDVNIFLDVLRWHGRAVNRDSVYSEG